MVPTTSVSASVKRLEEELGCRLFDRSANRITLNQSGKLLMDSLTTVFSELERTVGLLSDSEEDGGEVKILVRAIRSTLTDKIIEFNRLRPKAVFKTSFDLGDNEYEKYDVIIDEQTEKYEGYDSFEFCSLKLRLKVAKGSPLANERMTLSGLSDYPFISWGENSNMHKMLTKICKKAGFTPNIVAQCNDKECYEKLLHAGVGIGIGREKMEKDGESSVYLDLSDFDERYSVYVYTKPSAYHGNVKRFIDYLKNNRA